MGIGPYGKLTLTPSSSLALNSVVLLRRKMVEIYITTASLFVRAYFFKTKLL